MEKHRTIRACAVCGKPFYNSGDNHYCLECAKKKKVESVIKTRTCIDCGAEFLGGPRAKRCAECARIARAERNSEYRKKGVASRPIGSIDKCMVCGEEYIVNSGRQKYCSDKCKEIGVKEWQKDHKKGYDKSSGQEKKKIERRRNVVKICKYCERPFSSSSATNMCSDYCRKKQQQISYCNSDIKRGRNRNIERLIEERDKYRKEVAKLINNTQRDG